MTASDAPAEDRTQQALADAITASNFDSWYRKREERKNIRQGKPYFNTPSDPPEAERHSPSQLLQCHRKIAYRQTNAPAEQARPEGIFWFGSRFEEDVALPFLREYVVGPDTYAANSLWVDYTVDADAGELQIKGETDPVIVDREGQPILTTEIKTKQSLEAVDAPNRHHKAQVHAYMWGLSEKYDCSVTDAVILYGSRTTLDIAPFHVEFDPNFWTETVLDWAADHTDYRLDDDLPPPDPEFGWECDVCEYRQRCGKQETPYGDSGPVGLLPLMDTYPRARVREYLQARPDARLTPALAHEYPSLAADHGIYDWRCEVCQAEYPVGDIDWDGDTSRPPSCPSCATEQIDAPLTGPSPEQQAQSASTGDREESHP